ncbi:MAG: hypothetical protein JNM28_03835 [Armatimonadetes bacterium]|nr:hypothetical protein [Armatimonadota bacterium]
MTLRGSIFGVDYNVVWPIHSAAFCRLNCMRTLLAAGLLSFACSAFCAGGITITDTINNVLPSHPSLAGTYWGWNFRTNLSSGFRTYAITTETQLTFHRSYLTLTSSGASGVGGYAVVERRDPTIDFSLGSEVQANILNNINSSILSLATSPVPGAMIGIQDKNGRFFGVGFAWSGGSQYVRLINNPFTGAGTDWVNLPNNTTFFNLPSFQQEFSINLKIAGSRASLVVSGVQLADGTGNALTLSAGPPLSSLIFTEWVSYGGVIVGDYCTTDSGGLNLYSLSYY